MRVLHYQGEINEVGVQSTQALLAQALMDKEEKLWLSITSTGGNVVSGLGLFQTLRMMPFEVNTFASGFCGSIAATIFLAGQRRLAASNTAFVLHAATYTSGSLQGKISQETEQVSQPFAELLGWSEEERSSRFTEQDYRVSSIGAQEIGLVTEIGELKLGAEDKFIPIRTK
jgi:ATP-dependent protease ClpP protease subunit